MRSRRRPPTVHPASRWTGPVLCDVESRSHARLKDVGGRRYWDHPSSEVICAVFYSPESGEVASWQPGDPLPEIDTAVAHNAAMFDRFAGDRSGWRVRRWLDSSHAARRAGLPGALDVLASRWLGRRKDLVGSKFTKALSTASRAKARKGMLPDLTPEVRARVLSYCASDVEVMADTWDRLEPWIEVDADTAAADMAINDRGIFLDVDLVRATQRLVARKQDEAVEASARKLGIPFADCKRYSRSPIVFAEMARLPNAQAETLADEIARCDRKGIRPHPLVTARQTLASIIPGKLVAALNRVSDDSRLRDTHQYLGAHTWRWSSKGVQLHNLTRVEVTGGGKTVRRLVRAARAGAVPDALLREAFPDAKKDRENLLFAALIRACLRAAPGHKLAVLDYSGIEARGNAWAAGDRRALEVFRALDAGTGTDPYKLMAVDIFALPLEQIEKHHRQIGKNAELGCGYQMGADRFEDYCLNAGNDLAAMGVDPEDVIDAWRSKHRPIVQNWYAVQKAFVGACEGRDVQVGAFTYAPIGDGVACVMPNGQPLMYPEARAKRVQRRGKNGSMYAAWDITYQGARFREHLYGGKLVENMIQRLSRDLLRDALVRLNADGLRPVLHVHDEAVCELRDDEAEDGYAYMREVMADTPAWARGLPIKLDGFLERRYRK